MDKYLESLIRVDDWVCNQSINDGWTEDGDIESVVQNMAAEFTSNYTTEIKERIIDSRSRTREHYEVKEVN